MEKAGMIFTGFVRTKWIIRIFISALGPGHYGLFPGSSKKKNGRDWMSGSHPVLSGSSQR